MKKITLLGVEGCPTCARLDAKVQEAVAALAAPVEVEKITDPAKIMEINAGGLPAVLVDGEVKALRRVPEVKVTARLEQLSCPSCADMIVNVVRKIKGVEEAEVRYTTSKLLVTYDDAVVAWDEIEDTVTKLGYAVTGKSERRD